MSNAILQVTIRGRVQGVGYRAWVEHRARAHDLEGWVRNLQDGSVEALFSGPADIVAAMVERCRRGPSSARVDARRRRPSAGREVWTTVPSEVISQRVRIALQGHAPFAAATQAVYETLNALREGQSPKTLKGLASSGLTGRVTREADAKARGAAWLGLGK